MKALNLDQLAKVERTLTIEGVEHSVMEMTVGNFIETSAESKRLLNIKDPAEQLKATVALIQRSVPSLNPDTLHRMSFDKLHMVVQFIQGSMDDEKEVGDAEPGTEAEGEEKK
jgi:hypothetical protein